MERYLVTLILVVILISPLATPLAAGEKGQTAPRVFGVFAPKPGGWSEYAIYDKATGQKTVMRVAIVGVEDDYFWYEVVNREGGNSDIIKMLVKGDPNDSGNILRLIMKSGAVQAREMAPAFLPMGSRMAGHIFEQHSGIPPSVPEHLRQVKTGDGKVTVPAGTFTVSLHEIIDDTGTVYASYKFSQDVHPFGIVSSKAKRTTMVLVGQGTGAQSLITEKPIMMTQPSEMLELLGPVPRGAIRQIPGMGTGYEPR